MKTFAYIILFALVGAGSYAVWINDNSSKAEGASGLTIGATSTPVTSLPKPTARIFSDVLEPAWQNTSWNALVSISRSAAYGTSSVSLSVVFQKDWSGLYLRSSGYTPNETSLALALNAGTPENEDLYISLYGSNGKSFGSVPLLRYIPKFHMEKDRWYKVVIPLSDFHAAGKEITGVVVESAHPARVYFDDIGFVNDKPTPQVSAPTATVIIPFIQKIMQREKAPTPNATTSYDSKVTTEPSIAPVPTFVLPVVIEPQIAIKDTPQGKTELSPKPLPSTAQNIFLDSLLSGWTTDNSHVNVRFKPAYHGDFGMHLSLEGSWSEISFQNTNGIDASGYDGLWLSVKGDRGGEDVQLILYGLDGTKLGSARIQDFVEGLSISSEEYRSAYIPFRTIKLKQGIIGKIVLTSEKPAGFSLDDFQFSGEPSSLPAGGYYITAGPVFTAGFQNGWYTENWKASQTATSGATDMIESRIEEAGGGLYFKNNVGAQTHIVHRLKFQIKGPALSGPKISLALYDTNGKLLGSAYLNDYFQSTDFTIFQTLSMPLVYLGAEDSLVGSIVFSSGSATDTFYISNLRFEF